MLNRRGLLKSSLALAVTALTGAAETSLPAATPAWSPAYFESLAGKRLRLSGAVSGPARLDRIVQGASAGQFFVRFRFESSSAPAEGLYRLIHPLRKSITLFLQPARSDSEYRLLEAVINHSTA